MKGFVAQLTDAQIFGLPVGAVVGGAAIGGVGDALSGTLSGLVPQAPSWVVKAILALGVVNFLPKWVPGSKDIAQVGGLFLTYDAVQELFDVRGNISGMVGQLTGRVSGAVAPKTSNNNAVATSSGIGGGY